MKKYCKPFIEEEAIELEDIIALSGLKSVGADDEDSGIIEDPVTDLWS